MDIFDFSLAKEEIEKIDQIKSKPIFTANLEEKLKKIVLRNVSLED